MPRPAKVGQGPVPSPMMTLREVATYLRLHPSTLYRLAKEGVIPGFKVGNQWRFAIERVDQWMAGQEEAWAARAERL